MADLQPTTHPYPSTTQARRDRGTGRVFQRGTTFWIAYYLRGKEFRESSGTSDEKKAQRFLKRRLEEIGADRIGAKTFGGPKQERVLVREIVDELITEYKGGGKKGIPREVSPQMKSHLKRVLDYFGEMRAIDVHRRHVNEFIAALKADGKQNATVNRSLQLLGRAYALAVESDPPLLSRALKVPKLDESGNVRKGKFTNAEAESVFAGLPKYMQDFARFAYETGARAGEISKLRWSYAQRDAISVPATDTKNRETRSIALTPELQEIVRRRRAARVLGCDFIFHNDAQPIGDYRKCWHTVCVLLGLGAWYCRACRDQDGKYISALDAKKICPRCQKQWTKDGAKYIGRLFHDFRRTACHEMWVAGNAKSDCMEVSGHKTETMFERYADLFSDEEKQRRQREVQQRRREWREAQLENVVTMPAVN